MSSYEQKVELPDKNYQYLLFACDPYEIIAFKIPNIPIDKKNNYDIEAQKRIAERYSTIKEIKENIKSELEKIENVKVDIGL